MFVDMILSFVADQVDSLMGQATQQVDRLSDEVMGGLRGALNPLRSGAWTGQGAERFYGEMEQMVFPMILSIVTGGTDFTGIIRNAANIITQADEAVSGLFGGIVDMFDIF
ncbi:MAG: WXG100 family type VII secretion target [Anaerolineae bacterium]|jgi:hypothetical protein|nr:WXG100 family type VII secretion target [Anaerolineae bacterium]